MAIPLDKPVTCPVLIGRATHVEALGRALEQVRGGRGRTVLVAGEAGIGKSRLVAEAKAQAAGAGVTILEGHCFEPDRALPYAPLLDLLRAHLARRSPDDLAQALGPAASELVKLLPELATLLPGLAPSLALEPEPEQRRLFHALAHFLVGLAGAQPLLLIVEDLHWSDETSLDFLLALARRIPAHPLLLLLTYRSDEPHPTLNHFLAELDRERLAGELRLGRLSAGEVELMLRATFALARPVRAEFLDAIHGLTEGNPFFIEEVLRSLITAGGTFSAGGGWERQEIGALRIPRSIQDAVRRRAAQVSAAARQTLALAAVAGRRFDFALLQALTQQDEDDLLRLIKELIAAQLVVEVSAEQFAFRHALTRQAIYVELLARERKALHRRIADALERLSAGALDMHLEDLAYHFHEASIWTKARAYAHRAGERAQALYAPRAAVEQFTRALVAAHHLSLAPPATLYRGRGLAYATLGDFERAHADYETALDRARAASARQSEWQALLDLGLLWAGRDYARTGEYFRQALDLARAIGDPPILAQSLNRLGNWHMNVDQPREGQSCHQEALAIFRALNDRRGIAQTLDLLGLASNMSCELLESAAYYRQAVVLFRELDDRQALASSLTVLAERGDGYFFDTVVSPVTPVPEAAQDAELALKLAREIGWRAGEAYALGVLGACLGPQGEYARALNCMQASLAIAAEIDHREWLASAHCVLGALHRDLLALPLARHHLEQALALTQAMRSPFWVRIASGFLASLCVAQHDLATAAATLASALGPDVPAQTVGQRLCWCARAELDLARGEPTLALEIADRLIASAPNISDGRAIPRLWHLRAEALATLQRPGEAEAALGAAVEAAATQGRRPLLWRIHAALGKLHAAQRRHDEADHEWTAAHTIIEELAATVPDSLRDTFLQQATAWLPRPRSLTPLRAAKQAFSGLTAREREVAALIAQGKTNREIAAALSVSERTVAAHVSNMLTKLAFTSRAQIAGWASERGLTKPT